MDIAVDMASQASPYQGQHLDLGEVRLLTIEWHGNQIYMTTQVRKLDTIPDYVAKYIRTGVN